MPLYIADAPFFFFFYIWSVLKGNRNNSGSVFRYLMVANSIIFLQYVEQN